MAEKIQEENIQLDKLKTSKRKISVKLVMGIVAAVVAVVIIVMAVCFYRVDGYEKAVSNMACAIAENDYKAFKELSSSIFNDAVENILGDMTYADFNKESMNMVRDKYKKEVGTIHNITYEISDKKELSEKEFKDSFKEAGAIFDALGIDMKDTDEIVELEVILNVENKESDFFKDTVKLFALKESGEWKLLYTGL